MLIFCADTDQALHRRFNNKPPSSLEEQTLPASHFADRDPYCCLAFRQVLVQAFGKEGDDVNQVKNVTAAQVPFAEALVSIQPVQVELLTLCSHMWSTSQCHLSLCLSTACPFTFNFTKHHASVHPARCFIT